MSDPSGVGQFPGFQTCSGKPVQISAAAVARAKSIFKDEDVDDDVKTAAAAAAGFLNDDSLAGPSRDRAANAAPSFQAPALAPVPVAGGFTLASGKTVQISAAAIAKAKSVVFKDEDLQLPSLAIAIAKEDSVSKPQSTPTTFENQFKSAGPAAEKVGVPAAAPARRKTWFGKFVPPKVVAPPPPPAPAPLPVESSATFTSTSSKQPGATNGSTTKVPTTLIKFEESTSEAESPLQQQQHHCQRQQDEADKDTTDEERELSPILDPRQQDFFKAADAEKQAKAKAKAQRNLMQSFCVVTTSTPAPKPASTEDAGENTAAVHRMFRNIRHLNKAPSPKRTKMDESDLCTQELSDITNDLLADEEKCQLLGEDSFFFTSD